MVVLRSKLSGLYFSGFGVWIPNAELATRFPNEWSARSFVKIEGLDDVQVVETRGAAPLFNLAA